MKKFKRGVRVKVYGYTIRSNYEGHAFYNSGHTAKVIASLFDEVIIRFDGKCGRVCHCLIEGETHSSHPKQLRRVVTKRSRNVKK